MIYGFVITTIQSEAYTVDSKFVNYKCWFMFISNGICIAWRDVSFVVPIATREATMRDYCWCAGVIVLSGYWGMQYSSNMGYFIFYVFSFSCKYRINKQSFFVSSKFQVYETLEHRLVVAEAAQKLRLPLISKDGEIHEEEIEKWSIMSRSSLDSTSTSVTISSSSNSINYTNSSANSASGAASNTLSLTATDSVEPGVGGVPNRFLGITPAYLWQTQLQQVPLMMVGSPWHTNCSDTNFLSRCCERIFFSFFVFFNLSLFCVCNCRTWQNTRCLFPVRLRLVWKLNVTS